MDNLISFRRKAILQAYPSNGTYEKTPDGFYEKRFQDGGLIHIDRYIGSKRSSGSETLLLQKNDAAFQPLWSHNYCGGITDPKFYELEDEIFPFLQKALSIQPENIFEFQPRGPNLLNESNSPFIYTCDWKGSFEKFEGIEQIKYRDQEVFYHKFTGLCLF